MLRGEVDARALALLDFLSPRKSFWVFAAAPQLGGSSPDGDDGEVALLLVLGAAGRRGAHLELETSPALVPLAHQHLELVRGRQQVRNHLRGPPILHDDVRRPLWMGDHDTPPLAEQPEGVLESVPGPRQVV
eukprot:CAMPEP_0181260348 /NCGR_PEP_ID=MMETSP1097-20121128/899_1 /TAXON_ID=35684 /ORGANISM="Pseudopedinella elastica, Strain CCMP716" /LENGTH=131 /DNA_ID=CAMNT_0023358863 /DNA_START=1 /DNA_END=397 /DNA_ORIENTATION=+